MVAMLTSVAMVTIQSGHQPPLQLLTCSSLESTGLVKVRVSCSNCLLPVGCSEEKMAQAVGSVIYISY